jgi:hypothetical protein
MGHYTGKESRYAVKFLTVFQYRPSLWLVIMLKWRWLNVNVDSLVMWSYGGEHCHCRLTVMCLMLFADGLSLSLFEKYFVWFNVLERKVVIVI